MKRLHRLGSIAFLTVVISLVFHLLAMSFDDWLIDTCKDCKADNPLGSWKTSLRNRCYTSSMGSIFFRDNLSNPDFDPYSFKTDLCVPNQYLFAKNLKYANYCLSVALEYSDIVCSIGNYDKNMCRCDYLSRTKIVLAMTILTAFALGAMFILAHVAALIKFDYILRWLIPLCFGLLIVVLVCILVTLFVGGTNKMEDIEELRYSRLLTEQSMIENTTKIESFREMLKSEIQSKYSVKIGWCFGMEILSFHFALTSLVLFALMFYAKKRPESDD